MARQVGGAELVSLTVQRYYALDFANGTGPEQTRTETNEESLTSTL
jgi:hypothetical protein